MKKTIIAILAASCALTSCWKGEVIPSSDQDRHIISNLKAVAGDEEVALSWNMEKGWNPTDFIIIYTGSGDPTTLRTDGAMKYTVTGLENDTKYTFNVQAVYGEKISNQESITATPKTTRIAVTDLSAVAKAKSVVLTWTKPDTTLLSYELSYGIDGADGLQSVTIDKDTQEYTVTGLTDDENYVFSLVGIYPKGKSEPATVKAMPSSTIPYYVSNLSPASGQKVTFTFNRTGYPDATGVKWSFPDGTSSTDDIVEKSIVATGTQKVYLEATVKGSAKKWTIEMNLREYVVFTQDFACYDTNYNGFKGSCPVFSPDGKVVYDITFNKIAALYAYSVETGEELWRYVPEVAAGSYNPLTVNPVTGDIYYGTTTSGQFYCVGPDGKLKWTYTGLGSMQSCAPAVSKDGSTVFAIDNAGKTVSLNAATGAENWTYPAGDQGGSLLVNGDELVVAPKTKDLVFLKVSDGSLIASIAAGEFGANRTDIAGMAVAADKNTAYLPCNSGILCSIDLTEHKIIGKITLGVTEWASSNNLYEPAVAPNGNVYVGSKDSRLYCVKGDLSEMLWSVTPMATYAANGYNYSHVCCDASSNVYATSGQVLNVNLIVSPSGVVLDQWSYGDAAAQKQMGGNNYLDGVLYSAMIGGSGNNGYFVGKYVGGENADSWCRRGGDICGSCCVK